MSMIEIKNLTRAYGDLLAVNNISFTIDKGQVLGLLGPNGAGKTTTIRVLTCYLEATSGDISVNGISVNQDPRQVRSMIGYLPESAPLYGDMLVFDYLMFIAEIRDIPKDKRTGRIRELIEMCGLHAVIHKNINELSKGYKQRVGLAHAMMTDPQILVLDEPTNGLDPNQIIEIRELIKKIGKEKTVILSSHILSEVEATCDRVVIINKGKLVADGTVENLQEQMGQTAIIQVLLQKTDAEKAKKALSEVAGVSSVESSITEKGHLSLMISAQSQQDIRPAVYQKIKDSNWVLLGFTQEEKNLENIFRELTKEVKNV